jgi:hypothetical protein
MGHTKPASTWEHPFAQTEHNGRGRGGSSPTTASSMELALSKGLNIVRCASRNGARHDRNRNSVRSSTQLNPELFDKVDGCLCQSLSTTDPLARICVRALRDHHKGSDRAAPAPWLRQDFDGLQV